MSKKKSAIKGQDYEIDPSTKRSKFQKNNSTALIHGGYSKKVPTELFNSMLDNDLGFELGVLKGQLSNITILGEEVITRLVNEGEDSVALSVVLSCADRTAKLVPQIHKVLDSSFAKAESIQVNKTRNRWLNKLHRGNSSAIELAYQFEIHQLGELPKYVQQLLNQELSNQTSENEHEELSREQIFEKLEDYKNTINTEKMQLKQRALSISIEKQKINEQLFNGSDREIEN